MLAEVRVYGPDGKLKKTIPVSVLLNGDKTKRKLFSGYPGIYGDCANLGTDINLGAKRRNGYVKKQKQTRHLKCHFCGLKFTTTVRHKKYYCTSACGDQYRGKNRKNGRMYVNNSLEELVWRGVGVVKGASQDTKTRRGLQAR